MSFSPAPVTQLRRPFKPQFRGHARMVRCLALGAAAATGTTVLTVAQTAGQNPEFQRQEAPGRTIFQGPTVIDGTGAPPRADMAIVLDGELITAILPVSELTEDILANADVVDAGDWFAIPGLVESHTHLATEPDRGIAELVMRRQLFGGITTIRDMAGDARSLMELQRASLVKEIDAPDLFFAALMAGPDFFTDPRSSSAAAGETPGAVSWMQSVTDETDLAEAVTLARGSWATGIKAYARIDGDLLAKIAAEAARQGIPVWAHMYVGPAHALEVAQAGVRTMSHVCDIGSAAIPDDVFREGQEGLRSGLVEVDLSDPVVDSVFGIMRRNGTVLDATLRVTVEVTQERMAAIDTSGARPPEEAEDPGGPGDAPPGVDPNCGTADAMALTRRAYEAGVMISTGTDGMSPPDSAFPALYDEIRLLHEDVGMPMMDVLRAASFHGAVAMELEDAIGTLEPGKHGNIVFLREDPLAGAESLRSVELTVKRGTLYYRRDFGY